MDNDIVRDELNMLKKAVGNVTESASKKSFKWSYLSNETGRKALTIGIILAILSRCSGCMVLMTYTANIFEEAGSSMSPNMSAIVVGVIQLIGSYAATFLVDRAGRKVLSYCT